MFPKLKSESEVTEELLRIHRNNDGDWGYQRWEGAILNPPVKAKQDHGQLVLKLTRINSPKTQPGDGSANFKWAILFNGQTYDQGPNKSSDAIHSYLKVTKLEGHRTFDYDSLMRSKEIKNLLSHAIDKYRNVLNPYIVIRINVLANRKWKWKKEWEFPQEEERGARLV